MTDNLLEGGTPPQEPEFDDNYIPGEGKKFKSVEDLAKSKYQSDLYIKSMERQLDELKSDYTRLREDSTARANLEEVIKQLSEQQRLASSEHTQSERSNNTPPQIDTKEIESLVSSKIQEYELTKKQQENFNLVRSKLTERYGNNYPNVLKQQMESLGLSDGDINALAQKSPTAFFKAMGLDQEPQKDIFQAPPRSDRSGSFTPSTQKRDWTYYQNLKKDNPKLYWDPKTQVQMHKDAIALGDAFGLAQ